MKDIVFRILSLAIFSVLPALYLKIIKYRQEKVAEKFKNDLKTDFGEIIERIEKEYSKLNKLADEKRNLLIQFLRKKKITKEMFFFINERINDKINYAQIEYFKVLVKDIPEIQTALNIILLDNKITQDEVYAIYREIRESKSITAEKKEKIISVFTGNYINNKKVISSEELFDSLNIKSINIDKKRMKWYFAVGIPVLVILMSVTYIERYKVGLMKTDFTFGVALYRDEEIVSDFIEKLRNYLQTETGKNIEFKYYEKIDLREISKDVISGEVNGLIINPGLYTGLMESRPEILEDYLEVFAYHKKNEKDYFTNSVITLKTNFDEFCKKSGINPEYLNNNFLNDTSRTIIGNYIRAGNIAFSDRYSMAGYVIPAALWDEYQINLSSENENIVIYTQSFDESLKKLLNNEVRCAAVITERVKELTPDIKNKFVELYKTTEIPYHPYLISRTADTFLKNQLQKAFRKIQSDETKHSLEIKKNKMNITGWVECTSEEYYRKIENSLLSILNKKLPTPELYIENIATIPEYKENLNELIRMIKPRLSEYNAWEIVESERKNISRKNYHFRLNFFVNKLGKTDKEILDGYILKGNRTDSLLFTFSPDSLNGDTRKICNELISFILQYAAPKIKMHYDQNGLFIEKGRENGLVNCDLYIDDQLIDPGKYNIDLKRTSFVFNKPKEINKYRDKMVLLKYKLQ